MVVSLSLNLDVVFTLYAVAARSGAVLVDADGKPCGASIRMRAGPLVVRDRNNGCVFLAPGRQGGEFGDQYSADNVLSPVNSRKSFDQVAVR